MKNIAGLEYKILEAMQWYFGIDTMRIQHAQNVVKYAKEILKMEKGDYNVVIPAVFFFFRTGMSTNNNSTMVEA